MVDGANNWNDDLLETGPPASVAESRIDSGTGCGKKLFFLSVWSR